MGGQPSSEEKGHLKMPDPFLEITLKDKDQTALTALFSTVVLLTRQLEHVVYGSDSYARDRLYNLRKVGYVERKTPQFRKGDGKLWILTRREFFRELKWSRVYYDESYPELPSRLEHTVATNDIYVGARDELEYRFGDEDLGWKWKHEARAFDRFEVGSHSFVHQPDAELSFGERVFYIERQTEKSRQAPAEFHERMRRYTARERYLAHKDVIPEVLWACDTERDMRYARTAAERHGARAVCGSPEEIVAYVVRSVAEEASRLGMEPFEPERTQESKRKQNLYGRGKSRRRTDEDEGFQDWLEGDGYAVDF